MFFPPAGPLFLIGAEPCSYFSHLTSIHIFGEFHPHFEGSDFLLPEDIQPDRPGHEGIWAKVGGLVNGEPER